MSEIPSPSLTGTAYTNNLHRDVVARVFRPGGFLVRDQACAMAEARRPSTNAIQHAKTSNIH